MRWNDDHESPDVIDRRDESPSPRGFSRAGGGGIGGNLLISLLPLLLRHPLGWVVLVVGGGIYLFRGAMNPASSQVVNPRADSNSSRPGAQSQGAKAQAPKDNAAAFTAFVLDDAQDTWTRLLSGTRTPYRRAKLVLFREATPTGCGEGEAAVGPFYCPADERVYLDLGFFGELEQRFGAKGDFAKAYVIAHEVGHHVQTLTGASARVHAASRRQRDGAEGLSVRLELQADCYAGAWAASTEHRKLLEPGDLDEALGAAAAIGDDTLQRKASGRVRPESWTHGSSEQRSRWLKKGFTSKSLADCDTFAAPTL